MHCLLYPANASFDGFFPVRTGEPRDVSTTVDDLPHTETGGKRADRLQRDVDPKLRVSSKGKLS